MGCLKKKCTWLLLFQDVVMIPGIRHVLTFGVTFALASEALEVLARLLPLVWCPVVAVLAVLVAIP